MNKTTDKKQVRILLGILSAKSIHNIVLSPGSRNTPIIIGFAREPYFKKYVILDERCAGFTALGLSQQSGSPTVLACTSGTAILNYAPSIAEAYYQNIPLVVITADRPQEMIDQDDSQTLRQENIYSNYIKYSCSLPVEITCKEDETYTERLINQAVNIANRSPKGPVHINVPLREPLSGVTCTKSETPRIIDDICPKKQLSSLSAEMFASKITNSRKVMILASFSKYDKNISAALSELSLFPQIAILSESLSNIDVPQAINTIDRVLTFIRDDEKEDMAPDILITFGGSLVSKKIKQYLRIFTPAEHWNINESGFIVDTFGALTKQIDLSPSYFFGQLLQHSKPLKTGYNKAWHNMTSKAAEARTRYTESVGWSDLKAFSILLPSIPKGTALQLSNSTPVRYAQLFDCRQFFSVNSNRGVSGIDGSVSTAVGAAMADTERQVILITGDMGFLYDSNALSIADIPNNLKIVVIKNGGGSIFRFLQGAEPLDELERYFETVQDVDVKSFSDMYGFRYFHVADECGLKYILTDFFECEAKAILEVVTPRTENDIILRNYFKR
ncbi:MAG: 2-succinyl-5-enolpyruvyl-6-hydroxy-3-cyclohexene-1-carboxylic-acid synthase [Bacteroidales bacterium]